MDANDKLKRTTLRMPQHLYDRVEAAADKKGQSMNNAIVEALEEAFPIEPSWAIEEIQKEFARLDAEGRDTDPYRQVLTVALDHWTRKKRASDKKAAKLAKHAAQE